MIKTENPTHSSGNNEGRKKKKGKGPFSKTLNPQEKKKNFSSREKLRNTCAKNAKELGKKAITFFESRTEPKLIEANGMMENHVFAD